MHKNSKTLLKNDVTTTGDCCFACERVSVAQNKGGRSSRKKSLYTDFAPTKSVQALKKAISKFYCCEDFSVKGILGNGYYATVFLVHHHPTLRLMAVKWSRETCVQHKEIELLGSLKHKNIVRLYGTCVIGGRLSSLTEYANGGSLTGLLSAVNVDLTWTARIHLALDIVEGLDYLHAHQLIHRDLSSQNILIRVSYGHDSTTPDIAGPVGSLPVNGSVSAMVATPASRRTNILHAQQQQHTATLGDKPSNGFATAQQSGKQADVEEIEASDDEDDCVLEHERCTVPFDNLESWQSLESLAAIYRSSSLPPDSKDTLSCCPTGRPDNALSQPSSSVSHSVAPAELSRFQPTSLSDSPSPPHRQQAQFGLTNSTVTPNGTSGGGPQGFSRFPTILPCYQHLCCSAGGAADASFLAGGVTPSDIPSLPVQRLMQSVAVTAAASATGGPTPRSPDHSSVGQHCVQSPAPPTPAPDAAQLRVSCSCQLTSTASAGLPRGQPVFTALVADLGLCLDLNKFAEVSRLTLLKIRLDGLK